jgi:hypothetical protein
MAVRYTSPEFRATVTNQFDRLAAQHEKLLSESRQAEAAYLAMRGQSPLPDDIALGRAKNRWDAAKQAEEESLRHASLEKARPSVGVWERIQSESEEMMTRQSRQAGLQASADKARNPPQGSVQPWDADGDTTASIIEATLLSPEQDALVQAWKMGLSGKHPLPPEVMALFDLLVHDTMLSSWHDHVLSSTLYFRTREVDTFGSTDYVAEEKQRGRDEANASRASQINRGMNPGARVPARI